MPQQQRGAAVFFMLATMLAAALAQRDLPTWSPKDQPQLYLTPEVLAGLLAGFVCLCGVCIGVQCVMNIQSPRNFPKPEGQKL